MNGRPWAAGTPIVVRYRSADGRYLTARPLVVVDDSPERLVAHLPQGAEGSQSVLADGRSLRDVPVAERWAHRRGAARQISPNAMLMLFPRGRAHSLWVMWRDERLLGWYVNLEDPHVFGDHTISTRDHVLDLWIPVETGEPIWKDEDEFAAAIDVGRIGGEEAGRIRAEGRSVIADRPWPTGWEGWQTPSTWPLPTLPDGWDTP
jgi:hypothetical protein